MKGKSFLVPTIYILVIFSLTICLYISRNIYMDYQKDKVNEEITYVSSGIFTRTIPVVGVVDNIKAPYKEEKVTIGRYFYNKDDSIEQQQNSLVFYNDVYMPNTGIDYVYKDKFDVLSIYSGTVVDVKENELMGKTVEIRHNSDVISVYQGLSQVDVQKGDIVAIGMKIGVSGTNTINKSLGNHLHLEIYKNGEVIDPIKCIGKKLGDI